MGLFKFKIEWLEYFLKVFRSLLKSFRCQNRNTWRPIIRIIASVVCELGKRRMTCLQWHGADGFRWQPVSCVTWLDNEGFYKLLCLFKGLKVNFGSQAKFQGQASRDGFSAIFKNSWGCNYRGYLCTVFAHVVKSSVLFSEQGHSYSCKF